MPEGWFIMKRNCLGTGNYLEPSMMKQLDTLCWRGLKSYMHGTNIEKEHRTDAGARITDKRLLF